MNPGSSNWSWPEIEPLVATFPTETAEIILCGGQAVGFWAKCFNLEVVVSRDLDFIVLLPL